MDRKREAAEIMEGTKEEYRSEWSRLEKRYAEAAPDGREDLERFEAWLKMLAAGWKRKTWRKRRAAARFALGEMLETASDSEVSLLLGKLEIVERIETTAKAGEVPPRGPAKKLKKMPVAKLEKLLDELSKSKSAYASFASLYLVNSEIFGFRPVEWQSATIVQNRKSNELGIKVKNAKNSQGRANGDTRVVWLEEPNNELIRTFAAFIKAIKGYESEWDKTINSTAKLIFNIQARLRYKNKISMYSARHQFSANQKYSKRDLVGLAGLMGHRSIATATEHYGRATAGRTPVAVRPNEKNMDMVRNHSQDVEINTYKEQSKESEIRKET